MESRVSALEKWASEQRKQIADLRTDMTLVKESLPDIREIKEAQQTEEENCRL